MPPHFSLKSSDGVHNDSSTAYRVSERVLHFLFIAFMESENDFAVINDNCFGDSVSMHAC